jgi:hypothetical protein
MRGSLKVPRIMLEDERTGLVPAPETFEKSDSDWNTYLDEVY